MPLLLIGFILLAAGLLFVGQGWGLIRWPATSFMIDETRWIYYGGAIALAGLCSSSCHAAGEVPAAGRVCQPRPKAVPLLLSAWDWEVGHEPA